MDPRPNPPSRLPVERIVEFLEDRPGSLAETAMALRTLVLEEAPEAAESIHWGALSYHDPGCGGHVKGAVCQITLHDGRVRLSFIHGVRLPDPAGLLRGDRKSKRYVELRSAAEIPDLPLRALVRAAATCVRA
jgi:hypothetical protein